MNALREVNHEQALEAAVMIILEGEYSG